MHAHTSCGQVTRGSMLYIKLGVLFSTIDLDVRLQAVHRLTLNFMKNFSKGNSCCVTSIRICSPYSACMITLRISGHTAFSFL